MGSGNNPILERDGLFGHDSTLGPQSVTGIAWHPAYSGPGVAGY
jgi:hypothetical protein